MAILRIGHRGAAGHAPENTLRALEAAITLKADIASVDVRVSKDGHVVLIHDDRVDRTTNGKGLVSRMSLMELQKLDAGQGARIPTLVDALRTAHGRIGLIVELQLKGLAKRVMTLVSQNRFPGTLIYASSFQEELRQVRKLLPNAATMLLTNSMPRHPTPFAKNAKVSHIGIPLDQIRAAHVDSLHAAGLRVFVSTLNQPSEIQVARSYLVDGIISDFPDRI
jgi:glycerophosphoryl diester phosphodiesterase